MSLKSTSAEKSKVLTCPDKEAEQIREILWNNDSLLKGSPKNYLQHPLSGHCYIASEIYYQLLDNQQEWTPHSMIVEWDSGGVHHDMSHWFLQHDNGTVIDLTAEQFHMTPVELNYSGGTGRGFVPPSPSKRAVLVLNEMSDE